MGRVQTAAKNCNRPLTALLNCLIIASLTLSVIGHLGAEAK